jgi:hypothetical protein
MIHMRLLATLHLASDKGQGAVVALLREAGAV